MVIKLKFWVKSNDIIQNHIKKRDFDNSKKIREKKIKHINLYWIIDVLVEK